MKAVVVFESLFGNTAMIGEHVAAAFRARGLEAEALPVTHVEPATTRDIDMLVLGGPTHAHGMSRPGTRKAGATDPKNAYVEPTVEPGLREWFADVPVGNGRAAAAFDTRFDKPAWLTGSAAKGIATRLEQAGFWLASEPESFFVTSSNTLKDGEVEHAKTWAADIADRLLRSVGSMT